MHSNATYRNRANILKHPNRLYVRLPPHLAPAPRLGAAHLHRLEPARPGNPVARPAAPRSPRPRRPASMTRPTALPQLPRPAGAPGHLDPAPSARPSPSSAPRSRSP